MTETESVGASETHHHHDEPRSEDRFDRLGATLGLLCAVHCALTPLSVILAPIFGIGVLWTAEGEAALLLFALLFTVPSILSARGRRYAKRIIGLFLLSWTILVSATLLKHSEHQEHELGGHIAEQSLDRFSKDHKEEEHHQHAPLSVALAVLGGLGLTSAHLLNLRERRKSHQKCCAG